MWETPRFSGLGFSPSSMAERRSASSGVMYFSLAMRLRTWLRHFRLLAGLFRGESPFGFLIRAAMEAASRVVRSAGSLPK